MPDNGFGETTLDGFLDNQFKVLQPKAGSHRSGLDAILLAAGVPEDASGRLADFGAGCGVAGMAVAQRCSGLTCHLIELDPITHELCQQSLSLAENAHISDRLDTVLADLTSLKDGQYDYIIANPPYNDGRHQRSPSDGRADAHVMNEELLKLWVKSAARLGVAKSQLTMILRAENIADVLQALKGRFGAVRILPIQPKVGEKASRILVQGVKSSKGSTEIKPAFVVHESDGGFTEQAEDVFRGRTGIVL